MTTLIACIVLAFVLYAILSDNDETTAYDSDAIRPFTKNSQTGIDELDQTTQEQSDSNLPPLPKWKPDIPIDIDRIAKTFDYYCDNNAFFAVFENGTCVPVDMNSSHPEQDAMAILDDLFHMHPDFNSLSMDDGNWMITYSDRAYSICFTDEIEEHWDLIDSRHQDCIAEYEVLLNADQKPNVFDKRGKIGLFGRARWFMDCLNPNVIKVIRPTPDSST